MLKRLRWWRVVIGFVAVLAIAVAVVWRMTQMAPSWYAPPSAEDEQVLALAEEVEYRLLEQVQKIRSSDDTSWSRRVRQEQINAWLASRLRPWVEHEHGGEWPEALGIPQVRVQKDHISLAVPVTEGGTTRTIVAVLVPQLTADGLIVRLERVSVGRIGLPGDPIMAVSKRLSSMMPGHANEALLVHIMDVLAGRSSVPPAFELADGRRMRLLKLSLGEGVIDFKVDSDRAD